MSSQKEAAGVYYAKGFGLKGAISGALEGDYSSHLVDRIRENGYAWTQGRLKVTLAKEFGFCYGVERAIQYAYETKVRFPDRRIFLTSEIIHNPAVNKKLEEMGIRFLGRGGPAERFEGLAPEDVVLIPAFGVPTPVMDRLRATGCVQVDTTCGSVILVWKRVEQYAKDGFTSVVHGKYDHEETRATCSRVTQHPGGKYVVVRDMEEAKVVCDYIASGGEARAFRERFAKAVSPGFDPDRDLARVGVANQTTMMSGESLAIAGEVQKAMARRYGEAALAEHFRNFDTICGATQERQDAALEMMKQPPDLMLVIGGYTSSNTTHLAEIGIQKTPTYHIEGPASLMSAREIRHKPIGKPEEVRSGWLPQGNLTVGVTAGASTPNNTVGETIAKLFELATGGHPDL